MNDSNTPAIHGREKCSRNEDKALEQLVCRHETLSRRDRWNSAGFESHWPPSGDGQRFGAAL
jgi:hypothetical protein